MTPNRVEAELNQYLAACRGIYRGLTEGQAGALTAAFLDGYDRGAIALWARLATPDVDDTPEAAEAIAQQMQADVREAIEHAEARASKLAEGN